MTRQDGINYIVRALANYTLEAERDMFEHGIGEDIIADFVIEQNEEQFAALRAVFTDEELAEAVNSY